jgi:hypothetical protein
MTQTELERIKEILDQLPDPHESRCLAKALVNLSEDLISSKEDCVRIDSEADDYRERAYNAESRVEELEDEIAELTKKLKNSL